MDVDAQKGLIRARLDLAVLGSLFLAAFLIRLWPLFSIDQSWEDAYYYIELARSLSRGRWELLGALHTKYLPGFPAAILLLKTLFMSALSWFKSAQLVSALCSAMIPGLVYLVIHDIVEDRRAALAGGIMAALNAPLVAWAGVPFSESIFSFQVVLCLALLQRAPLAAGLIAGWAALTRHEGWFLAAAIFVSMAEPDRRGKKAAGTSIALLVPLSWWIYCHHETGKWLFQTYTSESAERASTLGRVGPWFLLLSLPMAGHLTTLFGLFGIPALIKNRRGLAVLAYAIPFVALHVWWMFGVERYFIPLVPVVCVMAGCGLHVLEGIWERRRQKDPDESIKPGYMKFVLPALGLAAGITHFAGFAPAMVMEESTRNQGYKKAIDYVAQKPDNFSVMAYDAFMVGYLDPSHPVIPTALAVKAGRLDAIPRLYAEQGLRYIIWGELYPADRNVLELSGGREFIISGTVTLQGKPAKLDLRVIPEKKYVWVHRYALEGGLAPWRQQGMAEARAIVYRLEPFR